jgi:hypothetical protein
LSLLFLLSSISLFHNYQLKETPFKKLLPTLPARKFFGTQDETFLDKRQVDLDRYLKKLGVCVFYLFTYLFHVYNREIGWNI